MSARRPHAPATGGRAGRPGGPAASGARPTAHRPGVRATGSARLGTGARGPASSRGQAGAARPAPATPPRGGPERTSLPGLFTVRALVLFVVGLVAFVLLFPTVKAYLAQKSDNERLVQQVAQAKELNDNLGAELQRWDDPAYVAAQARERLAFVLPGETAFRVVDPEIVPDPTATAAAAAGDGPALAPAGTTTPWYTTIWDSLQVAGAADAPATSPATPGATSPESPPATSPGSTPATAPATAPSSNGTP